MMNVLRDGCSERGTARVGKRHDLKTVRWYVLTLPTTGVARRDRISPAKSLDAELSRRKRRGETLDRKSTRLNSSHTDSSRMPSSA